MALAPPPSSTATPPTTPGRRPSPHGGGGRRFGRGRRTPLLLGLAGLFAAGVALAAAPGRGRSGAGLFGSRGAEVAGFRVAPSDLRLTIAVHGDLESSRNLDVTCQVEGQTTIISILPQGTQVRKGELVCELDAASLRDNLINQQVTTRKAEADLESATMTLRVAEIAVKEYRDGTYPQTLEAARGELKLAQSDLAQAVARAEWSSRMADLGVLTASQGRADRMAREKCQTAYANAQTRIRVLETYTRRKTLLDLEAAVRNAATDEIAKRAVLALERSKQAKIEAQIARCKLVAPRDGLVVYANEQAMRPGASQALIEEGATVRERQKIFSLPDVTQMHIKAKIHESQIRQVVPGVKAAVRVDGFPGGRLSGTVVAIRPLADPADMAKPDARVYTAQVAIDAPPPGLRPGMTADADLLVERRDGVLTVPLDAVVEAGGKAFVYVLGAEAPSRREVALGLMSGRRFEVKGGLRAGEEVAEDPLPLMTEAEKIEATQIRQATTRSDWGPASSESS